MTIQVECKTQSQIRQSDPSKERLSPSITSPKESSSRNQSRSNMAPGCRSSKEKKQKKDTTQQNESAEVFKTINKRLQEKSTIFSVKVKKGDD